MAAVGKIVAPSDLPARHPTGPAERPVVHDSPADTPVGLDRIDAVVTGCEVAIAETGTTLRVCGPPEPSEAT